MAVAGPYNFSGGYCPGYNFLAFPPGKNYAFEFRNCKFKNGCVTPRWAQKLVNLTTLGTTRYVTGLKVWNDAVNAKSALVAICDSKVWIADATGYTTNSSGISFTDRTGAVSVSNVATTRYSFDSLNGILVGVGNSANSGVPFKITAYNANAAVLAGSPPNGDAIKQVNNFLFIGRQLGSASTYSRVNYSNVGDSETWTVGNYVDFNKSDGEPVMALGSIGTDLYIFKQTSIGRLDTYTNVIAGATALGPLQTVVRGVGCAGPLALDNLPNGNIVFLGYDGHLYEFNGSTLVDLSKRPYPGVNCYDSSESYVYCGINVGSVDGNALVKVWKGINEVWVAFESNVSSFSAFNVFAYDYENAIWQGNISDTAPKSFATLTISGIPGVFEATEVLFHGNATGSVFSRGDTVKRYPVDESGVAAAFNFGMVIQMGKEASDFVPRSIVYETDLTSAGLAGLSLSVVYDTPFVGGVGGVGGSGIGVLPKRTFVNLPIRQDSPGSNILPRMITLRWAGSGTGSTTLEVLHFGNFYLSDEVVR